MSVWNDPQMVSRLKQYWLSGMTGPAIAGALGHGLTPRAVRAKAKNLGFPQRNVVFILPYQGHAGASRNKTKTEPVKPAVSKADEPKPIGLVADFPDRERSSCRYIHGEVSSGNWQLCGMPGYPWCEHHTARLNTPQTGVSKIDAKVVRNSGINRCLS